MDFGVGGFHIRWLTVGPPFGCQDGWQESYCASKRIFGGEDFVVAGSDGLT